VAEPAWLEQLVETAEACPEAGLVTGKFLKRGDSNTLDSTGEFYSVWGMSFPRGRGEVDAGQYDDPAQWIVFGGTGGASLYRIQALREVGLFDENFFAYCEDVDISFRLQLSNWKACYSPTAEHTITLVGPAESWAISHVITRSRTTTTSTSKICRGGCSGNTFRNFSPGCLWSQPIARSMGNYSCG